jgi:hypothetical protein
VESYCAHLLYDGYRVSGAAQARLRHSLTHTPQLLDFRASFLFVKIVSSSLSFKELVSVALHFTIFLSGDVRHRVVRRHGYRRLENAMRRAMTASVLFYNSGNYGVPVAQLAFPARLSPKACRPSP